MASLTERQIFFLTAGPYAGLYRYCRAALLLLFSVPLLAQQNSPTPTLRTRVNLVVLDVVVTGPDRQPVRNLKAEDFAVLENNVSQRLTVLEEHSPGPAIHPALPPLVPGAFTNYSQFRGGGPLNVLLLDALDTDPIDQARMRQEVLAFLDDARPGTQFAFFALDTGGLKILQGATENLDLLRAALNKFHPVLNVFQGRLTPAQRALKPHYTLDAVNALSRYLAGIPGRKNLLWFASHFTFNLVPDASMSNPFASTPADADEFRNTVDLLTQHQVSIYPINAQGLTGGSQSEDNLAASDLAARTGGAANNNSNDIRGIIARDVVQGSTYYTLGYSPVDPKYDGRYRSLKVVVRQPGVTLSYRHGYYADDPDHPVAHGKPAPTNTARSSSMEMALTRGMPEASQVLLFVQVHPAATSSAERDVAAGNKPGPKLKGPFQRYAVDVIFDPRTVSFQRQADGKLHNTVAIVSLLYDSDNRVVNTVANDAVLALTESPESLMEKGGIPVHQELSVPAKGDYFLRIAVHDKQGDRIGAIEVPISAVRNLPPKAK